ncbi:MAG: hypothetical protein KJ607_08390, partial [Bacteroidetes bacterium]|nr:hypothetical protein [Bacteroidota bacterium]
MNMTLFTRGILIKIWLIIVIIASSYYAADSQTTILSENFENGGAIPTGWIQEYVTPAPNINWIYEAGGYSFGSPASAHGGSYNAVYYSSTVGKKTKLITSEIDFGTYTENTTLTFWHAQVVNGSYQDELRIYYKTSAGGAWTLLSEYTAQVVTWTQRVISLPDPNSTYYIAFEGTRNWGQGACVDDVLVTGEASGPKALNTITYNQASTNDVIVGTTKNEILRLDVNVTGSTGTLYLNSIVVTSLNTTDADISNNGVKLYRTATTTFATDNQLGTSQSFSSGTATFSSLNYDLPGGTTYIWVTYDIASGATVSNIADAKIEANNIDIASSTYPSSEQSPAGSRTIANPSYCTSSGSNSLYGYVKRVQFNTLDNSTTWDGGYLDATGTTTNVTIDESYDLSLTRYCLYSITIYTRAWIDFNKDGDFEDVNEEVMPIGSEFGSGDKIRIVSVTIPSGAAVGTTRLRVIMKQGAAIDANGCETYQYSETEDYGIVITAPADEDSKAENPDTQIPAADFSSLNNTDPDAQEVFSFKITDLSTTDELVTKVTQITIKPGASNTADWTDHIQGIKLHNGTSFVTTGIPTIADESITIPVTSGNLDVPDGTSITCTLYVYLSTSNIVDGAVLDFRIDYDDHGFTADPSYSTFATTFGSADIEGNNMTIDVDATELRFETSKPPTWVAPDEDFNVTVQAVDENGNIDTDISNSVTLSLNSGAGILSSVTGLTQSLTSGTYDWTDIQYDTEDDFTIKATATGAPINAEFVISYTIECSEYDLLFCETFESVTEYWGLRLIPGQSGTQYGWDFYDDGGSSGSKWNITSNYCSCNISGDYSLSVGGEFFPQDPCEYDESLSDIIAFHAVNSTGYEGIVLDFIWQCNGEAAEDYGMVCYSLDGMTWTNVDATQYQGQLTTQPVTNLILPSACDNENFYIGFRWIDCGDVTCGIDYFAPGFIVDDICVKGILCTAPVAPTSAASDRNNFCDDDAGTISLTATGGSGGTLTWYAGGCGSGGPIGTGTPLVIASPATTTIYYARWEKFCGNSSCANVTVTVLTDPGTYTMTGPSGNGCAGSLSITWNPSSGATTYDLWYCTGASCNPTLGTEETGVTSPYVFDASSESTIYNFIIQAYNACGSTWSSGTSSFTTYDGYTWSGDALTTSWNTGGNWCGGLVPTTTSDVLIPVVSNPYPVLDVVANCHDITINNGASLDLDNLAINVYGDWNNSGTLNPGSGTVKFTGSDATQYLRNGASAFKHLTVDKSAGTVQIDNNSIDVNGHLKLSLGTFDVSASNYNINLAGDWINNGGAFTLRLGRVTFDGTTEQEITSGSSSFYNV